VEASVIMARSDVGAEDGLGVDAKG